MFKKVFIVQNFCQEIRCSWIFKSYHHNFLYYHNRCYCCSLSDSQHLQENLSVCVSLGNPNETSMLWTFRWKAIFIFLKVFFKKGPIPASFCLFSSFSHNNFNYTNWKKHRWCSWDSNPWLWDGRRTRNPRARAATLLAVFCLVYINECES